MKSKSIPFFAVVFTAAVWLVGGGLPGCARSATGTYEQNCGNGTVDQGEECDDGNNDPGDGCSGTCTIEPQATCGDGRLDEGEECDDGNNVSGDGCDASCHNEFCGDGVTQTGLGEECDDGNNDPGDGCNASCHDEFCGDGVTQTGLGEECDDGDQNSDSQPDACRTNCTNHRCGDGVTDSGEQCDDGNTVNGDGCSASCQIECDPNHNIATGATATSSGGGTTSTGYGPENMNDGHGQDECSSYSPHWISAGSSPGASWAQLTWSSQVTVARLSIDTVNAWSGGCSASSGRSLAGGQIQFWNGSGWQSAGTISGQTDDWTFTFSNPVQTTALRIYGVYATDVTGQKSNPVIVEWQVFECN